MRAYGELVRVANLFTAAADPVAGWLYVGGGFDDCRRLLLLGSASMLLYAGGVALNDVCDVDRDAKERPERPIPSGRIGKREAASVSVALLVTGIVVAGIVGYRAAGVAAALALSIVAYDLVLKRTPAAPWMMGLCRGLNLMMGMQAVAPDVSAQALIPVACMGFYVTSVTFFARREADVTSRQRVLLGTVGACVAAAGLCGLRLINPPVTDGSFVFGAVFLSVLIAMIGAGAIREPSPRKVQSAIRWFVLLIIVLDACVAWAGAGWEAGLIVASLLLPAMLFARAFRVT